MEDPPSWRAPAGKFIVLDGPDGCGKTTQLDLLEQNFRAGGVAVCRVREPGGTPIGEQIRGLLLSSRGEGLHMRTEMLLYMASRAQLVQERIKPALANGQTVLSDRYTSSTLAYQGTGGGLPWNDILAVARAATENVQPDLTIILDLPVDKALARLGNGGKNGKRGNQPQSGLFHDRIEQRTKSYHENVRRGFLLQAEQFPDHYRIVRALGDPGAVAEHVAETIVNFFHLVP